MPSRLGNNLFQLASLLGIALKNNRTAVLLDEDLKNIDQYFSNLPVIRSKSIVKDNASHFVEVFEKHCWSHNNMTEHLPKKNITVGIYLQSRLYLIPNENAMRNALIFKETISSKAQSILNSTKPNQWDGQTFIRVAIHIRRGDLLKYFDNKSRIRFVEEETPKYIRRAMEYFLVCYDRVQYIVFSDDIKWCRKNINGSNVIFSEKQSPGVDMALCSLCDHMIITVGTFGVWSAWFANGITIRPKLSFLPRPERLQTERDILYYYPEGTIEL
jgi:galactoside 2-L-fucosyltransferase 1/2